MPKFIITWDAGFGEQAEIVECEDQQRAEEAAEGALQEDLQANYGCAAEPYSAERAEELGLETEETESE
jgi:hypothetical protein